MRIGRLGSLWPSKRRREADVCRRCRTSFRFSPAHHTIAESHLLPYVVVAAPLCDPCWRDLDLRGRVGFYRDLHVERAGENVDENRLVWQAIETAVAAGL